MSELLKSRHAFGSEANLQSALDQKLIDAYDILFLKEGKIGWIDAQGNPVILEDKTGVKSVDVLPETGELETVYIYDSKLYFWNGTEFVAPIDEIGVTAEEVDAKIDTAVSDVVIQANAYTDDKIEVIDEITEKVKYEIISAPKGTLIDYRDKEIRVMIPANTEFELQNSGTGASPNLYYIEMRAYAPEGANSYKETTIANDPTIYYFENNGFAGTDKYGRKYAITWWSVASYDEATDAWTYFGAESTKDNFFTKDYYVEWYDVNGALITSDFIKVSLSNEECHSAIEPCYVNNAVETAKAYTDEQIANAVAIVEF